MTDYEVLLNAMVKGKPPVAPPKELSENTDLYFEYMHFPYRNGTNSSELEDLIVPYYIQLNPAVGSGGWEHKQISVQLVPEDAEYIVTFASSNPEYVSVDERGVLTGHDGNPDPIALDIPSEDVTMLCDAVITVTAGNISKQCGIGLEQAVQ